MAHDAYAPWRHYKETHPWARSKAVRLAAAYGAGALGGAATGFILSALGFGFEAIAVGAVAVPLAVMVAVDLRRGFYRRR